MKIIMHLDSPEDLILAARAAARAWRNNIKENDITMIEYENGDAFQVWGNKKSIGLAKSQ